MSVAHSGRISQSHRQVAAAAGVSYFNIDVSQDLDDKRSHGLGIEFELQVPFRSISGQISLDRTR